MTDYQSNIKLSVKLADLEVGMQSFDPADLAECIAPLGSEERRSVRAHWEQVIREEFVPVAERVACVPSLAELDERRARRRARRGLASVTRLAQVRQLRNDRPASESRSTGPEAA